MPRDRVRGIDAGWRGYCVNQLLVVDRCHAHLEPTGEVNSTLGLPRAIACLRGCGPRRAAKFRFERRDRQVLIASPDAHVPKILWVPLARIELVVDRRAIGGT